MRKWVLVLPRKAASTAFGMLALAAGVVPHAKAQIAPLIPGVATPEATVPERLSVAQRTDPEYAPIGAQVGDFLVFPTLDVNELYNSNVYVSETGEKSDWATFVDPTIAMQSNWNRNALNFLVGGDIRRYASQVSENESNVNVATNGRVDISQNVYLTGGLGYQLAHEERTSPNSVSNQLTPTLYELMSGRLGYVHDVGIVGFRLDTGADYYSYNNNLLIQPNGVPAPINETGRNRVEYGVTPRVTYEIVPGYHAFIQTPVNVREYQSTFDETGYKRSSHGYEIDAGTAFEVSSVINGEVYVGYFEQDYVDTRLPTASGPAFGGNLLWNPTQLTSVRLSASRTVAETTLATTVSPISGYLQSQVALTLEHLLLRNVLLTGGVSYTDQDYQGAIPARDDTLYGGTVGGRYLINEYLRADLTANYSTRLSNVSPNSYHQTTLLAGLHLQY